MLLFSNRCVWRCAACEDPVQQERQCTDPNVRTSPSTLG